MNKHNKPKHNNSTNVTAIDVNEIRIDNPEYAPGDLGQVQQILFGQQLRANTDQFAKLNRHIEAQLAKLADTCQQQFTELRSKIDTSIDSLKESQSQHDKDYQAKLTAISHNHASFETSFSEKLRANSDSAASVQQQLNSQIEKSSAVFSESLGSTRDELTNMLEAAIAELQTQKLDRAALSNLLGTVAVQLSNGQLTNGQQPSDGTSGDNQQQPHQHRTGSIDGN